jgi:hypothetical protein
VSFAGTTLLNFLVRVIRGSVPNPAVTVHNETSLVRRLIRVAGLGPLVGLASDGSTPRTVLECVGPDS